MIPDATMSNLDPSRAVTIYHRDGNEADRLRRASRLAPSEPNKAELVKEIREAIAARQRELDIAKTQITVLTAAIHNLVTRLHDLE